MTLTLAYPTPSRARSPTISPIQSITTSLQQTSASLDTNSDIVVRAAAHLSYDATSNLDPTTDLTNAINQAALALWSSAYDVEKNVHAITKSSRDGFGKSDVEALKSAIVSETKSIVKLEKALKGAVDGIVHSMLLILI